MNIFVVEDEYWSLSEMQFLLESYEKDNNIYYYKNGEEALREYYLKSPDLIITDITMPKLNGLDLIKIIRANNSAIQFILLTVHDTFSFAKQAIELGVASYLLKPVKKQELYATLDNKIEKILNLKLNSKIHNQLIVKKELFNSIMNKTTEDRFKDYEFLFYDVLIDNWSSDSEICEEKISTFFNTYFSQKDIDFWMIYLENNHLIVLIQSLDSIDKFKLSKEFFDYLRTIGQPHLVFLKKTSNNALYDLFIESEYLLNDRKKFGNPTYIIDKEKLIDEEIVSLWDKVRLLEKKVSEKKYASINKIITQLMNEIEKKEMTQKELFSFLRDVYFGLLYNFNIAEKSKEKREQTDIFLNELNSLTSYYELEEWFNKLINKLIFSLDIPDVSPKDLIPQIKMLIDNSDPINFSLQNFAEEHHISLSYLSKEFKDQIQLTFSDYLTFTRIERAKQLLKNDIYKTKDIAELVGYNDVKYFREVFKKNTGKTINQFKRFN